MGVSCPEWLGRLSPEEQARFTEGLPVFVWGLDALIEWGRGGRIRRTGLAQARRGSAAVSASGLEHLLRRVTADADYTPTLLHRTCLTSRAQTSQQGEYAPGCQPHNAGVPSDGGSGDSKSFDGLGEA